MTGQNNQITSASIPSSSLDWDAFDASSANIQRFLDQSSQYGKVFPNILHHAVTRFNAKKDEATKKTLETIAAHPATTSYINHKNSVGQTQLHLAATLNNPEAFKILLNNNANPNIVDSNGVKPGEQTKNLQIKDLFLYHSDPKVSEGAPIPNKFNDSSVKKLTAGDKDKELPNKKAETSSPSIENTSLFSWLGSFFKSLLWTQQTQDQSAILTAGDKDKELPNEKTATSSPSIENTSLFSWLGSFFKSLWPQKVQDPQSVVQNQNELTLNGKPIDTITNNTQATQNQDDNMTPVSAFNDAEVIQQIIATLPDLPKDEAPTTLGDPNEQVE